MHLCNKAKPGYVYLPKYEFMVLDFSNQSTKLKGIFLVKKVFPTFNSNIKVGFE